MKWYVGLGLPLFFLPSDATAELITPTQAFASSYLNSSYAPINLINNSGLNTSSPGVNLWTATANSNANGMWVAGEGQGTGGSAPVVANQYLVFDLGNRYNLSTAYIWQMIQTNLTGRGIKEFELYGSSTAPSAANVSNPPATYDLTGFKQIMAPGTLPQASGGSTFTRFITLNQAINIRQVYLKINSDWNGLTNDYVGLSEIKFEGTLNTSVFYNWANAAGGSWQTAGNWSVAGGPPTANDEVTFDLNDTYTVTSGSNVGLTALNVSAGDVTLDLGSTTLQTTRISLTGGKLTVPALVSTAPTAGQVGFSQPMTFSDGTLEVVGGRYRPTTSTFTSNTPVPVSREGSWAISGTAGTSAKPTLELVGGAVASNPSPNSFGSIIIGINGGKGAVRVSDPGSSLTLNQVIQHDLNTLHVGLGGAIIGGNFARSEGSLDVLNKATASGIANVALGTDGAIGAATVDDATLSAGGNLIVGWRRYSNDANRESQGSLAITNGGKASGSAGLYIGSRGGTGVATVDGAGSSISSPNVLFVGWNRFSGGSTASANGALTLTNGASASGAWVWIGTDGGVGTVNVDSNSTLAANNGWILLGYNSTSNLAGEGTLNITGGGVATTPYVTQIGTTNAGKGSATVNGPGSTLNTGLETIIGGNGTGSLTIQNGGTVNSGDNVTVGWGDVGPYVTTGTVTVDGANSSLNGSKDIVIGYSTGTIGSGTLNVTNGGRVSSLANLEIGKAGGKGDVTVGKSDGSDTGISKISTTGNLNLGAGGTNGAKLTVNAKGLVEVGGNLDATPSAAPAAGAIQINLAGGTIKTSTTNFADAAYLNWTGGALWYTGGTGADSWVGANDTATLTVPAGAVLKGSTNLRGQLAVSGTVSPGDEHSTATFNARNLSIGTTGINASQGELAADINFTNNAADLLSITGSVDLINAKLSLSLLDAPLGELPTPLTFLLIANDGSDLVAGTFAEIDLGTLSPSQYIVDYAFNGAALNGTGTGNDVAITFVPEPSMLTLLVTAGLLMRRRRSVV